MRLFFYSYGSRINFVVTKECGIFGAKKNQNSSKVSKLKIGDFVIVRDSSVAFECRIFGCGVVVGPVFDQQRQAEDPPPLPRLLWPDEVSNDRILYPLRIPISFDARIAPEITPNIDWTKLAELGLRNQQGHLMTSQQQLGPWMGGNFVDPPNDGVRFLELLGFQTHRPA